MNRKHRTDRPKSPDDLNDIFVHPVKLTKKQEKEAALALAESRRILQASNKPSDILRAELMKLRFQIEDYISENAYNHNYSFGFFLKEYVRILNKKRKVFAEEISIDDAMLSNYINLHRTPPDYISIRLEIHSKNLIPAEFWYKLIEKEKIHVIRTDKELRESQRKFVYDQVLV